MNKQDQGRGSAGDGMSPEKITEIMADPAFTAEQLPGLWQQIADPYTLAGSSAGSSADYWDSWRAGVEAMYRRCETYPQHTKIGDILCELPSNARHRPGWAAALADELLGRATPDQLLQALEHEQQHPMGWWPVSHLIMMQATAEQLTGPVIEQLRWNTYLVDWAAGTETPTDAGLGRCRHILDYVQQRLLAGSEGAWAVFLGIAESGTLIGEAVELANAIEHKNSPHLNSQ